MSSNIKLEIYPKLTWALIDHIEKRRVHCELWQFEMGGGWGVNLKIYPKLTWALIDRIEKQRVHCELWQFETWGG